MLHDISISKVQIRIYIRLRRIVHVDREFVSRTRTRNEKNKLPGPFQGYSFPVPGPYPPYSRGVARA
jgi:hypothetical protein